MSGMTVHDLRVLPEADVYFYEAMDEMEGLNPDEQVRALRRYIREQHTAVKTEAALLHSRVRALFEVDVVAARDFLRDFTNYDSLKQYLTAANKTLVFDRTAIATIQQHWPEWDWKLPNNRTPERWTSRLLKDLRWLARKNANISTLTPLLESLIVERVTQRTGKQGASKSPRLQAADLRSLVQKVKSNAPTLFNASTVQVVEEEVAQESSALSVEAGRTVGEPLNESFVSWLEVPGEEMQEPAVTVLSSDGPVEGNNSNNNNNNNEDEPQAQEPAAAAAAQGRQIDQADADADADAADTNGETRPTKKQKRRGPAKHDVAQDMRRLLASLQAEEQKALHTMLAAPASAEEARARSAAHQKAQANVTDFARFVAGSGYALGE